MSPQLLKTWIINKNHGLIVKLGWFYRFSRPMAAILDFRTFMGQILIDFFLSCTISSRIKKNVEKPFVIIFLGLGWLFTYIYPSIRCISKLLFFNVLVFFSIWKGCALKSVSEAVKLFLNCKNTLRGPPFNLQGRGWSIFLKYFETKLSLNK